MNFETIEIFNIVGLLYYKNMSYYTQYFSIKKSLENPNYDWRVPPISVSTSPNNYRYVSSTTAPSSPTSCSTFSSAGGQNTGVCKLPSPF